MKWVSVAGRPDRNEGLITFVVRTPYNKPTRHQTGAVECLPHGADFDPDQSAKHTSSCIKSKSEPTLDADRGSNDKPIHVEAHPCASSCLEQNRWKSHVV